MMEFLRKWTSASTMTLQDAESGKGLMQYLSSAFTYAAADLSLFSAFIASMKRHHSVKGKHPSCVIPEPLAQALAGWCEAFESWDRSCPIVGRFSPVAAAQTVGTYDASTSWGAGGAFWSEKEPGVCKVFARPWTEHERGLAKRELSASTGLLEAMAGVMWLERFVRECTGTRLCFLGDNASAVLGFHKSFSPRPDMAAQFREGRRLVSKWGVCFRARYVHTSLNCIADLLSHGLFVQATCTCVSRQAGLRLIWA